MDVFTFCYIGRIVNDKGINELVHAIVKLARTHKKIKLVVVGGYEKDLDPILPESVFQLENHPMIEFVGYQKDVRPYLAISDAFVFPSYREGFPNVVMQAGAMGVPCIVTDINGCNEIIIEGVNGEIIPPQNEPELYKKMKEWVENPDRVKKMSESCRELIQNRYEQKYVWESLLKEYKSLLDL